MITLILRTFCICAVSWTCFAFIRWFTTRSPLDNIPGPPSQSFWKGNLSQLMDRNGWEFHQHIASTYGNVVKITGMFGAKELYVFDPKALHYIVIKDQDIYEPTTTFMQSVRLVFGQGLFATLGDRHRKQRRMLNPVFSPNHMRYMLPTFYSVAGKLRDAIASQIGRSGTAEIDILHWMTRAALELIGQSGLGYSFDPLTEDIVNPYVTAIKSLLPELFALALPRKFIPFFMQATSPKFPKFMLNILPWKTTLCKVRDTANILRAMSSEVLETKRSALSHGDTVVSEQIGRGKDLISILMKDNMEASEEDRLTEAELLGQVSTFIFAAMDTTSSALARTLQVLAEHPTAQEKLRKEIIEAHSRGDLAYDQIVALPYLDAVCKEILRLYAPLSVLFRTNRKDVTLPLSKPIRGVDGKEISEIPLPINTNIIIGIMALNRNPDIWGEDALEWKPERWLTPLPDSVSEARVPGVYSHMMTFVGGRKACIGFNFALLEMKVVLSLLLGSFSFSPTDKDIAWNMAAQAWPSVKGAEGAHLPLRVSKLAQEGH